MEKINQKVEQEKAYKEYIKEHICNVRFIWKKIGNTHDLRLDDAQWHVIDNLIIIHDKSKYSFDEFNGYRANFFPIDDEKGKEFFKKCFDRAWNYHQKSNPHHWNFWVMFEGKDNIKVLDMPLEYAVEMLCDWSAMSLKFNNTPSEYYSKNKGRIIIGANTRKYIERIIPFFDKAVKNILKNK